MLNLKKSKILLTGGHGFVGTKVYDELLRVGVKKENIYRPKSTELDLHLAGNSAKAVKGRDLVFHLAASVGGIGYNQDHPGKLFYDNAIMGINLIEAARQAKVKKFVQVGTVCSYPKFPEHIPFKEGDLWKGYPEETNAPYGLSKLMLLEMLQAYRKEFGINGIYLLPTNIYGPGDNFDFHSSHVIPALIKKFVEARNNQQPEVVVWGTGSASREFFYVDDAARGIVLAAQKYDKSEPVNIGSNNEVKIKQLANMIAGIVDFKGKVVWDKTKPDGQPRRRLNVSRAKKEFGFMAKISLQQGLKNTIAWYIKQSDK